MMTFGLAMSSNCTNLLSMRSWIWCLKCAHSSRVCSLAPKWCSHFMDGPKPGKGGPSLDLMKIGVTSFFSKGDGVNFRGSALGYCGGSSLPPRYRIECSVRCLG